MTNRLAAVVTASGVLGGIVSAVIGGWDLALETLAIVMALDYLTGLIVAGVFHKSPKSAGGALESKAAFKGLCKKAMIMIFVVAFHQADRLTGKTFFRDGCCTAFFIAEFISVTENIGLVMPLPAFVSKALDWFREKGEKLGDGEMQNAEGKMKNDGTPPHPSSGLRETPDATFPSRGRLGTEDAGGRILRSAQNDRTGDARAADDRPYGGEERRDGEPVLYGARAADDRPCGDCGRQSAVPTGGKEDVK